MPGNNNGEDKVVFDIPHDGRGKFLSRNNRFLGTVRIGSNIERAHIHDPGRLEELLFEGNWVLLKRYKGKNRKTEWEIMGALGDGEWVFLNSKFHSQIARRILEYPRISPLGRVNSIHPEVTVGNSRLDFLIRKGEKRIWVEVKGCTLVHNHVALFPDAPTARGRRHVEELVKLKRGGDRGALIFLVFRNARCFSPNAERDEKFARAFYKALREGVEIYPLHLSYDGHHIHYKGKIGICEKGKIK